MKFLLRNQYEILFAASSEEVNRVLEQNSGIAIILMDVSLRGSEDGLMITERLRKTKMWKDVPIIAVTAHAFPADQRLAFESGCNDYICKPINQSKLFEMMSKLIAATAGD